MFSDSRNVIMSGLFDRIGLKMQEPQLDGIFGWFQHFVMTVVKSVLDYFTNGFGPDMGRFRDYIGSSNVAALQTILIGTGIGLASVIFIFHLITVSMQSINDSKESIPNLLYRYLVAMLLISTGPAFVEEWILGTAQEIYIAISEINPEAGGFSTYVDGLAESFVNSIVNDASIPGFGILTAILYIIFGITLFFNFFKFALNIIQRYVSMCIIVLFFPVAASTYTSRGTSSVFNSYIRMLLTEVIMLVLNEFFIIGFLSFISTGYAHGVIGLAFAIAFLRVSQTADSYLRSVGMSTGQTGQNLLDEAMGAATRIGFMGRQAGEVFKGAKNLAGGIKQAAGLKSGDFGKFLSGQKASNGESAVASAGQNLKNFQNTGGKLNADDKNVVKEASRAAMTSGYKDLATLPADVQQAAVNNTLGEGVAKAAEDAGLSGAKLNNVAVDNAGNIAADMSYGNGRSMPVNMTHTPPKDPSRAIGTVTDSAGNRMYLSRAEGPSDVLNRARTQGNLNMANPDVHDAVKQSMAQNGNAALKNMPHNVQSDAFKQFHGEGFNRMAASAGLGIAASDMKNIAVDGSGAIKGNASIGGRQMDMTIANTPPRNQNELLGTYTDSLGNNQYVSAKPSEPMDIGDDIEYKPVDNSSPAGGEPVNLAGDNAADMSSAENVHNEQPDTISLDGPEPVGGEAENGSYDTGATEPVGGDAEGGSFDTGTAEPVGGEAESGSFDTGTTEPVGGDAESGSFDTGTAESAGGEANGGFYDGSAYEELVGNEVNGSSSNDSGTPDPVGGNAESGSYEGGEAEPVGSGTAGGSYESGSAEPVGSSVGGSYDSTASEPVGGANEGNVSETVGGGADGNVSGMGVSAAGESSSVNAPTGNIQSDGGTSADESIPFSSEDFEPEAIAVNSGSHDAPDIPGQAAESPTAGVSASGQTEHGTESTVSPAPAETVQHTSNSGEGAPNAAPAASGSHQDVPVSDTSSSSSEEGNAPGAAQPAGSTRYSAGTRSESGSGNASSGAESSHGSGSPSGSVSESIPFEATGSQRSPSEIAAGVTLNDRWKSAHAESLKGARFTPTSEGGMELRSYSNEVMMYQDPKGKQHYSFGTKMVNEADFSAGGTYETAGLKNVKIKGRNNDGSFTIEADGFDQGGNPIRQNYLCQDYAQNHGQKGRVVNGNRRHPSLLISAVRDKKRNLFGGKESKL